MSEIEKLYKNAHIKKVINHECTYDYGITCPNDNDICENCGYYKKKEPDYPPFTAEKQLELLLFCTIWGQVHIIRGIDDGYRIENCCYRYGYQPTIAEAIANHLNEKWHILTAEQQEQIADILKG